VTYTFVRTPFDEGSVNRRDLYQTTHSTHKRQTSMLPAEFELASCHKTTARPLGSTRTWFQVALMCQLCCAEHNCQLNIRKSIHEVKSLTKRRLEQCSELEGVTILIWKFGRPINVIRRRYHNPKIVLFWWIVLNYGRYSTINKNFGCFAWLDFIKCSYGNTRCILWKQKLHIRF
jgi:hypothetical protein